MMSIVTSPDRMLNSLTSRIEAKCRKMALQRQHFLLTATDYIQVILHSRVGYNILNCTPAEWIVNAQSTVCIVV